MIRMTLGAILVIAAVINDFSLTVGAASAAHLSFWQYAMLNKLGVAVLLWGYNPGLMILGAIALIGGFFLFQAERDANTSSSYEVSDWRSRV